MASGDSVQQIKDRLDIVDVVSTYVELTKAGKNFKGKSPFTNEKTPSFYVSPDRGMYYCFSTSQGGDIFTFIQVMEGVDFKGALKILADKAGVELVPEDPKKKSERDRQYDVLEEATKFFEKQLQSTESAQTYLVDRGVAAETRARWRIGYAPGPPQGGWRELKSYLEEKQFTKDELVRAGLIKGLDTGKEPYDVFRDRIMFPISDASGRVVAYSGRILSKDSDAPKYVNSPETELFVKSDILYGYDKAKEGIRKLNFSLIVEGQFDVVLAHQAGYNNTVAVSGTALTAHHVDLLQRLSNRVVLALDDDRAGIAAVKRAADLMLGRGMDVKVARLKEGEDPADMIRDNVDGFRTAVKTAQPVVGFLLSILKKAGQDERAFKLLVREEVLPYVARIPNAIDREHFAGIIADTIDTTKSAIQIELNKLLDAKPAPAQPGPLGATKIPTKDTTDQVVEHLRQIFGALHFLERFTEGEQLVKEIRLIIRKYLHEEYEKLETDIGLLNPVIMEFESKYQAYPDHNFFDNFFTRINYLLKKIIDKRLSEQRVIMDTHEAGSQEYGQAEKEAEILRLSKVHYEAELDALRGKKD